MINYYYNETHKSIKDRRRDEEKKLIKTSKDVSYPDYNALKEEMNEEEPQLLFTIRNSDDFVIKKVLKNPSKGFNRFHWDLRYEITNPVSFSSPSFYNPFAGTREGTLVEPGNYTIQMDYLLNGEITKLADPKEFKVSLLDNTVMPAKDRKEKIQFQREVAKMQGEISSYSSIFSEISNKIKYFEVAVLRLEKPMGELLSDLNEIKEHSREIRVMFYGDNVKRKLDMQEIPTPSSRVGIIASEQKYSTSSPTQTHINSFKIAKEEFGPIKTKVDSLVEKVKSLEDKMKLVGAAYTPGRFEN
jgi:hypothetical protein